jgi:hypothetical protein
MTTEVEQKASEMGWSPKETFRGDPEKWVDAEAFVKRGEELMPILQANNRRLLGEVSNLRNDLAATKETLKASSEAIEELKTYNSEATRIAMKAQRKDLVRAIEVARKDGEVETVTELTEQLDEHTAALAEAENTKPSGKKPNGRAEPVVTAPVVDPEFATWAAENPWYGTDLKRTALANAIGQELRKDTANALLGGRKFLEKIEVELDMFLGGNTARNGASRVEGGKRGGDGGGGGKSYVDLPADAKAACERAAMRVVGKGRAYTNIVDWQKKYASDFFAE